MSRAAPCRGARPPPPHRSGDRRALALRCSASQRRPRSSASSSTGRRAAPVELADPVEPGEDAAIRPCLDASGALATRPLRLRHESVNLPGRLRAGSGAQPEQRVVERAHERRPVAVTERLDERPPDRVLRPRGRLLTRGQRAQRQRGSPAAPRWRRRAARRRAAPTSRRAGRASAPRSCSERNGSFWKRESSQRSSASASGASASASASRPSTSRVTSARKESSRVGSPGGCVAAIGSTGRIPNGRQSSRSKSTGPAATGAAVASRIAETASASSAGASGGSSPGSRPALELEHAVAVDLPAEAGREQALRLGPVMRELARRCGAKPDPAAELDLGDDREADERRDGRVRVLPAEERALELGVGALEGAVVPVEAAAGLRRRDQERERARCGRAPAPRSASARRERARRSPRRARAAARPARSGRRPASRARSPATRRRCARAAGTRRAPARHAGRAPRTRTGRSSPSSSARPRKTNAPRQKPRRVRCRCGARTAIRPAYSPGGSPPAWQPGHQ